MRCYFLCNQSPIKDVGNNRHTKKTMFCFYEVYKVEKSVCVCVFRLTWNL